MKKLHTFVTERILETKVAGHFVAMLCRAFSRVNPEETLKCLVPHLCNTVLSLTESEDIQKEEVLSDELLYNMLILSEVSRRYFTSSIVLNFFEKVNSAKYFSMGKI